MHNANSGQIVTLQAILVIATTCIFHLTSIVSLHSRAKIYMTKKEIYSLREKKESKKG